ncbi:MAG: hypothetical protein ACLFTJ_11050, partial [Halothece sp.]
PSNNATKLKPKTELSSNNYQFSESHQEEIEVNRQFPNQSQNNNESNSSFSDQNDYNIFDLRYEVTRYTTPLRIKILLFSTLYYKIGFNEQDWSLMISHQLDSLLKQAIKMFPTLTELETRLYATAKNFEEKEGLTQAVGAIIQSIRPFYENGKPQLSK